MAVYHWPMLLLRIIMSVRSIEGVKLEANVIGQAIWHSWGPAIVLN